ncbi:MAG: CapA family protein [Bacillota bacterium]
MKVARKSRLYGSIMLFILLAKVTIVSRPLTLYVPDSLHEVGKAVARQNGLVLTSVSAAADFYLTLEDGIKIGEEPLVLYANDKNESMTVPYLEKSPLYRSIPVNGCLPHESEYPNKRDINLAKREVSLFEKIWQGSRTLQVDKAYRHISFELKPTVVALTGDIMLGRRVGEKILDKGPEYPFTKVYQNLQKADISFANLEAPTCVTGEFINLFRAHPSVIDGLKISGIDVVSLANNHILDYHQEGMFETWEHLNKAGILQIGTGMNLTEATKGVVFDVNGIRIGFLAYTETWFLYSRKGIKWVADEYPGVAPINKDLIISDVKRLKKDDVDIVIVSLHWGIEYSQTTTKEEEGLAKAIINAGGDVVFGHHPHVIKPWGFYKEKPVFYSVGNFIFDTLKPPLTEKGLLVELVYLDGLRDVYVTITRLEDCQVQLTKLPPPKPNAIIN